MDMILLMFEGFKRILKKSFRETLVSHIGVMFCHMNKPFTFGREHELKNLSTPLEDKKNPSLLGFNGKIFFACKFPSTRFHHH